jgi:hypothetical protein
MTIKTFIIGKCPIQVPVKNYENVVTIDCQAKVLPYTDGCYHQKKSFQRDIFLMLEARRMPCVFGQVFCGALVRLKAHRFYFNE